MTVSCLNPIQKQIVIDYYSNKSYSQAELARQYHVSERTIHRVLVEAGLATPVARIQGEAYAVMQFLKENDLDLAKLKQLLKKPDPWYPDDSGEWVEVTEGQPALPEETCVEILVNEERETKQWASYPGKINEWTWSFSPEHSNAIVAYKVVK